MSYGSMYFSGPDIIIFPLLKFSLFYPVLYCIRVIQIIVGTSHLCVCFSTEKLFSLLNFCTYIYIFNRNQCNKEYTWVLLTLQSSFTIHRYFKCVRILTSKGYSQSLMQEQWCFNYTFLHSLQHTSCFLQYSLKVILPNERKFQVYDCMRTQWFQFPMSVLTWFNSLTFVE